MRKQIAAVIVAVTLLFAASPLIFVPMTGCSTSQQRQTVNTLKSVGQTTDAAFKAYLDGVREGRIKTNDVPSVAARYAEFQTDFNAALILATLNTNAPPTPEVTASAANLKSAISVAKQK